LSHTESGKPKRENNMKRIDEHWDTEGLINEESNPYDEYELYMEWHCENYPGMKPDFSVRDFKDYIEKLKLEKMA
jgi:hypothetical protein